MRMLVVTANSQNLEKCTLQKMVLIIVGTSNLPGTLANTASMLYSNNLTTFITSLVDKENGFQISEDDDILVGAPEGNDFHVPGMGGVLICKDGEMHPKQTRLGGVL